MHITISHLELWTQIGIPKTERSGEQLVLADLVIVCSDRTLGSDSPDDIVDYENIVQRVKLLAKAERKTLEKFAEDIAGELQSIAGIKSITVTLKKFALPGTKNVSVTIKRP